MCPKNDRPFGLSLSVLTHWGQDNKSAILQMTFLDAFSWMKTFEFQIKFHWNIVLMFD